MGYSPWGCSPRVRLDWAHAHIAVFICTSYLFITSNIVWIGHTLSVYPVSHMEELPDLFLQWLHRFTSHYKLQCVQGLIFPCPCQHLPLYVSVGSPPRGVRWRLIVCLFQIMSLHLFILALCAVHAFLVSHPGIKLGPLHWEHSLNHQTTRDVPLIVVLIWDSRWLMTLSIF